jgi:hypothetical protein
MCKLRKTWLIWVLDWRKLGYLMWDQIQSWNVAKYGCMVMLLMLLLRGSFSLSVSLDLVQKQTLMSTSRGLSLTMIFCSAVNTNRVAQLQLRIEF